MSMSDQGSFPFTESQLVGNYCETLALGVYLVTCGFCARTLLFTDGPEERLRKPNEIRWLLLSFAIMLFIIGVFDDVIGLSRNLNAFVWYRGPGGAQQALQDSTNIGNWICTSRFVAQFVNMVLADFILIYRCYIVYARSWRVIIPSVILYVGGVAMSLAILGVAITKSSAISLNWWSVIKPWWAAFFAITALQNLLTTSLLIWRIWRVEHQNVKYCAEDQNSHPRHQLQLRRLIRVIAESGAVYTTMVFVTFIVSMYNNNTTYPLSDVTLQVTGITFNILIVRCSPRRDKQFTTYINGRSLAECGQRRMATVGSIHFVSRTSAQGDAGYIDTQTATSIRHDAESHLEGYE